MTIDLDTARRYVKADGDDDDTITMLLASAQSICEGYCNRRFYENQAASDADFAAALSEGAAAKIAFQAQIDASTDLPMLRLVTDRATETFGRIKQRTNGVVIDGTIDAAMLLTLGHLYFNREDNIVSGANAVQLPVGAQRILQPYLWIGDLVGVDACWSGS